VVFLFDKFVMDTRRRELRCGAEARAVEPQVFDLLEYLIRNRDRVVSKDDMLAAVWNGRIVSEATMSSRINAARTAIEDNGNEQRLIRTVLRKGVRFVCDVREQQESGTATAEQAEQILALPDKPSIAVLPFQNMSGDPGQEYFVDGIVEEIISGLSRIKWLFVIARNSSFTYKGRAVDVKQVGRELGVRYVLEGSVRKAGNHIRITSQLVEAETGSHLWAERHDGLLNDIFAVQDEITASVVGAIEPSLRKAEIQRIQRKHPDSLDAYDLVLRALPFLYSAMPGGVADAIPLLEKALQIDPGYARAHADLAWCLHHRFIRGDHREEDREGAIKHAREAVAGAGDDATALGIAAFVISLDAHDNATALSLFDRALALSNSNIFALGCSAVALAFMGNTELAIERAQRALRLSPFDPLNVRPYLALSNAYFQAGRYEEAADAARRAIEFNPGFSVPHALLAAALARLGRVGEARAAAQRVLALEPTFTVQGFGAMVGAAAAVFAPFAEAWIEAGLPER
jgi:TolB-like protein/Tfp pilus assembly protein PilF